MKVLVFSDSHGRRQLIEQMLENEPQCKRAFFLGDGLGEVQWAEEFYPDIKFTSVRGNNDWRYKGDYEAYAHIEGVTVFACHGDGCEVRTSLRYLCQKAKNVGAPLALYGHTHVAKITKDPATGVTAVNPGALCDGKYCVIDFSKGSFAVEHKSCY